MNIDINLKQIIDEIMQKIENPDTETLEDTEREYFGKDGVMTRILKSLPRYSIENRRKIGFEINKIKNILKNETKNRKKRLKKDFLLKKINKEKLDYSPAFYFPFSNGSFHPVVQAIKEMLLIFKSFGFSVIDGPEIETDWYNFQALNIPEDHPAKDIHDTFYVNGMNNLLRTHTSPGQIHAMESQDPPIKIVVPGRVYRNESSDASHSSTFHQIEGLKVDKNVTFSDLKIILVNFIRDFFCDKLNIRFRPSYFQFTEPSAEVDVQCFACSGVGCKICKNSGWIEMLGCGMVHPNVLNSVNYNSDIYVGYAFGIGVERLVMLKYKIDDIRLFYENDLSFLKQF